MWGYPGVTTKMNLFNSQANWASGGVPVNITINRGDILRDILVLTSGQQTLTPGTGTIALDPHGPYNQYTNVSLGPSNSAKIVNVSGYGMYLANLIKAKEYPMRVLDSPDIVVQNPSPITDVTAFATSGTAYSNFFRVPVSQIIRSMAQEVGMWQLSEQTMNMVLSLTPNSSSSSSPFSIGNTTAGISPFLLSGNATATLTNPTIDVLRLLYKNPLNPQDFPPFDFVSVWTEDSFVNPTTKNPTYTFPANSGYLCRAIINAFDATAGNGAAIGTYFSQPNAFTLLYGTSDTKHSMSGYELQEVTLQSFGFLPPKGVFFFDFLGEDLTLLDVLNTALLLNIRFQLNLSTPLPANSTINVIYQLLQPIIVS